MKNVRLWSSKHHLCVQLFERDQNKLQIANNLEVESSRIISSTRLSSFSSQPLFPASYVPLGKLKIHLWTEKAQSKLQTLIWNGIQCRQLPKVVLLCWGSEHDHCWIQPAWKKTCKCPQVTALPWARITQGADTADRLSSPRVTALLPVPAALLSAHLHSTWLLPPWESLFRSHLTPPASCLSSHSANLSSEVMFSLSPVILRALLWTWVHIFLGPWGTKLERAQSGAKELCNFRAK